MLIVVKLTRTCHLSSLRYLSSPERVCGQADVLEGVIGEDVEGEEGQRDEASDQPGEPHSQVGVSCSGGPAGGMQDQLVTLQSDQNQREDGNRHRHALNEGRHLQTGGENRFRADKCVY